MWDTFPDDATIGKTVTALTANNIDAMVVVSKEEARQKLLAMIPKGAEVFTLTSITLEAIGILPDINESGNYKSIRNQLNSMDRVTQGAGMQKLGAAPEWAVGSVHAVTTDGQVMIASNTGSQLASYASGAAHVIWVVGAQKIVSSLDDGFRRIHEHSLPLESERMGKKLGKPFTSGVNKILIVNKEFRPHRINLIFVKEVLGF